MSIFFLQFVILVKNLLVFSRQQFFKELPIFFSYLINKFSHSLSLAIVFLFLCLFFFPQVVTHFKNSLVHLTQSNSFSHCLYFLIKSLSQSHNCLFKNAIGPYFSLFHTLNIFHQLSNLLFSRDMSKSPKIFSETRFLSRKLLPASNLFSSPALNDSSDPSEEDQMETFDDFKSTPLKCYVT